MPELQRRGCDIGRTAYAKYESGELNIRASVLIELRKIYSCSYDDFFAGLDRNIEQQSHAFDLLLLKNEVIGKHRYRLFSVLSSPIEWDLLGGP